MRFAVITLLVLALFAVTFALPAKSAPPSSCTRACTFNYDPICGKAKNGSKERLLTFGNKCVMENYNCEHADDPYVKKTAGECGDNVSVRLQ